MIYLYIGLAAYLVLGFVLTRVVLKGTTMRLSFRDLVVGPVAMPVLFLVLLVFDISEEAWSNLLAMLAFDRPEIMRAKPIDRFVPDKIDIK